MAEPLLVLRGLRHEYRPLAGSRRAGPVVALDGVDLEVRAGETLALVGESGSGKTTLARAVAGLIEPTAGSIRFRGEEWLRLRPRELRRRRRYLQIVFQDPYLSLDPRMRIDEAVVEPAAVHGLVPRSGRRALAERLLAEVGLAAEISGRHPHQLSGGQRQRVAIARALASGPELLVADEPFSALDASVRAQVVELLRRLARERGLAILLVEHDLALAAAVAGRVAVLRRGRIVEEAEAVTLLAAPRHPCTAALLAAAELGSLEPFAQPDVMRNNAEPGANQ